MCEAPLFVVAEVTRRFVGMLRAARSAETMEAWLAAPAEPTLTRRRLCTGLY
jgi:hypothetical protein